MKTNRQNTCKTTPRNAHHLMKLLPDGYLLMTLDGVVQETNAAMLKILGCSEKDLLAYTFFKHWNNEALGAYFIDQVITEKLVLGFTVELKHDAVTLSINAQLTPHKKETTPYIECIISDITTKYQAQHEFDKTLRDMTGGIAHLINNQMASVVGNAGIMKAELVNQPALVEKLERITESGMRASDVAHKLVDYAESLELAPKENIKLQHIISVIAKKIQNEIKLKEPRNISFKAKKNLPCIEGNEVQLLTLLKHLLDNAIEATQKYGMITVSCCIEELPSKHTGETRYKYVTLTVADDGHGMDPETQRRIFEPFFTTHFLGRGMSLAHVLKIVKGHHARIHVKTSVAQGCIFKVLFPIASNQ